MLNHAPSKNLGLRDSKQPGVYRTALEVFTGHKPVRPLLRAIPKHAYEMCRTEDEIRARQLIGVDTLQEALREMHRNTAATLNTARGKKVERHNRMTNISRASYIGATFHIGDFVLVRRPQPKGHKLQFLWRGPRRVTSVKSEWVYQVEPLDGGKAELVHARRLTLYRSDMDGCEPEPALLAAAKHSEVVVEMAKRIRDIRRKDNSFEFMIEWEGLPDSVDMTWEPLETVKEDLPGILQDYLYTANKRELNHQALKLCSF